MFSNTGLVLLCGGLSSRMGYPKPFLKFGNVTLIERTVDIYREAGIREIVVVMNHHLFEDKWLKVIDELSGFCMVLENFQPQLGRSFSVTAGLKELNSASAAFIHNIDNPVVSVNLLHNMINAIQEESYVVPRFQGIGGHPVLLAQSVISHLTGLKNYDWILKEELRKFQNISIDAGEELVHLNLNTQEDYNNYLSCH